jgi:O-methyltransferase
VGSDDDVAQVATRLEEIQSGLQRIERRLDAKERSRLKITDKQFVRLAREVRDEGRTLLGDDRLWTLWQAVGNAHCLGLAALEAGTYRGGSAAFLAGAWRTVTGSEIELDVVDTFTGHPRGAADEHDHADHHVPRFTDTSEVEVSRYLSRFPAVRVHAGTLEDTMPMLEARRYGLVHLDMDLYQPTITGLRFVHDRLPPGGVVVLDDYGARKCPGVAAAAAEFLEEHPVYHAWDPLTEQLVLSRWR